jgi:hypothetical protein
MRMLVPPSSSTRPAMRSPLSASLIVEGANVSPDRAVETGSDGRVRSR